MYHICYFSYTLLYSVLNFTRDECQRFLIKLALTYSPKLRQKFDSPKCLYELPYSSLYTCFEFNYLSYLSSCHFKVKIICCHLRYIIYYTLHLTNYFHYLLIEYIDTYLKAISFKNISIKLMLSVSDCLLNK